MTHPGKKTKVARNAALLFGKAVREARIAAKLTLEEAAKKADLRIDFLSRVERGEEHLPFAAMMRLADGLQSQAGCVLEMERTTDRQRMARPDKQMAGRMLCPAALSV